MKTTEVLLAAIRDGVQSMWWERETFAYADSWDADHNRYLGLKAGQQVNVILNADILLVKPEVAAIQIAADTAPVTPPPQPAASTTTMTYAGGQSRPNPAITERSGVSTVVTQGQTTTPALFPAASPAAEESRFHRFHGSVQLNERMMARDAGTIMEEVVKHLTSLYGAKVKVTLEIEAEMPDGVPEKVVRDVLENCRTLKLESFGFEEE